MLPAEDMKCLKDCCRTLMKKRTEQETQGRSLSACRCPIQLFFCHDSLNFSQSDHAEGSSAPGSTVGAADGREQTRDRGRLPAVQTTSGWQRGALCPAHLQGLLHPTQRVPVPQPQGWTSEYVHRHQLTLTYAAFP